MASNIVLNREARRFTCVSRCNLSIYLSSVILCNSFFTCQRELSFGKTSTQNIPSLPGNCGRQGKYIFTQLGLYLHGILRDIMI